MRNDGALITTCSKEKRLDAIPLPAAQRYISDRIGQIIAEGERRGKQVYILSGKHGLLKPDEEIDWYDKPLIPEDEPSITELVARRLVDEKVDRIVFYAKPIDTPGWRHYYNVITTACNRLGIKLLVKLWGLKPVTAVKA